MTHQHAFVIFDLCGIIARYENDEEFREDIIFFLII